MEKAPINIYLRDFLDLKISQDRLLNERFAPANLYQKLNYYGGKAAISLVAPCIVVTLLVCSGRLVKVEPYLYWV
jgi:hypothetical protein